MHPKPIPLLAAIAVTLVSACVKPPPTPPAVQPKPVVKPSPPKKGVVSSISLTTLFELHQAGRVLAVDARPGFVYAFGHLPGAVNWPRLSFDSTAAQHDAELKKAVASDRVIVVYCTDAACPDAAAVAQRISTLGHPVSVLEGGFAAWKEADLPTE
jgi:rhodanese-related sulfurtransferase